MARHLRVETENSRFQQLLALRSNRQKRHRLGVVPVDGVRALNAALDHGFTFTSVARDATRPLSGWAERFIAAAGCDVLELSPALMGRLSQREETSELVATVAIPDDTAVLGRHRAGSCSLVLAVDRPQSPGNLGTTLRSAAVLGADLVAVVGHACDVYDPACVRASVGAVFQVPVVRLEAAEALETWSAGRRIPFQWIGTDSDGETPVWEIDLRQPTVLVLGNEAQGLSDHWRRRSTQIARIPLVPGSVNSLNLATAATACLYEVRRQRGVERRAMPRAGDSPANRFP